MLNRKIKIITCVFSFLVLFGFAETVQAAVSIDVSGTHDHMFSNDNIYPGWTDSHAINIKNTSNNSEVVDVYANFEITDNSNLTKKIHLYVIRESDNKYMLGGLGDRITLDGADGNKIFIDRLNAGKDNDYKIKFRFDSDAGNEYQNLNTDFNINLRFESDEVSGGGTPLPREVSGQTPQEEVQGVYTPEEESPNQGEQLGAESEKICSGWPQWAWILALLVYAGVLARYLRRGYIQEKIVWKFAVIWTMVTAASWYFFDKCLEYKWFLYSFIIIAIASYFIYLRMLRKKTRKMELPAGPEEQK